MSPHKTGRQPKTIYLNDYRVPDYLIDSVDLAFDLDEAATTVTSRLALRRNPLGQSATPLVLNGERLTLKSIAMDGQPLAADAYRLGPDALVIEHPPERFVLDVETGINPQENSALEGLYTSGGNFCTQCEAEGFRKITYYLARPDVMASFTTLIRADKARYPVLLSNGNLVEQGELAQGRHYAKWVDPFKKPCYLFALVAGDLAHLEDVFVTAGGRPVTLRIYVSPGRLDQCAHAMRSLKHAMAWDERVFGLEYDLDVYMIVAVDDFNMGAMENKGLNLFNAHYVLANPETATDSDYDGIESVIGHEYFHNWTGNRVTCRDWFQLSLKEGLTVFRDQEFSADMGSRAVARIQEVRALRTVQFAEDTGPMAHPVRPESYMEISNFYTATVYSKGAEVIRMLRTLIGAAAFRRGMELYIARHDGQAVTTDDFVQAMADAAGRDLTRFRRWYSQAGTPVLRIEAAYDPDALEYTLRVRQSCAPTPGQPVKEPLHIPLSVALLDAQGKEMPLQLVGERTPAGTARVLELTEEAHAFRFLNIRERPYPSLLRGFSAPVRLESNCTAEELAFLASHDTDPFNRWDAGQRLFTRTLLGLVETCRHGGTLGLDPIVAEVVGRTLAGAEKDCAAAAQALALPGEAYLAELMTPVDVEAIHAAREFARATLRRQLGAEWLATYRRLRPAGPYQYDAQASGRRALKNTCLRYLMAEEDETAITLCMEQFRSADNMTDSLAALTALADLDRPEREQALGAFEARWRHDALVMDKWFSVQATSRLPQALEHVRALMRHPAFDIKNPNKVRALIGAFCRGNPTAFHAASGAGYAWLADQVLAIDRLNPQGAARLAGVLSAWRRYDAGRSALMRSQLERILAAPNLSKDTFEVAEKSLGVAA